MNLYSTVTHTQYSGLFRSLDNDITLILGDCDACGTLVVMKNVHRGVRHESLFPEFTQPADLSCMFAMQILQNTVKCL